MVANSASSNPKMPLGSKVPLLFFFFEHQVEGIGEINYKGQKEGERASCGLS